MKRRNLLLLLISITLSSYNYLNATIVVVKNNLNTFTPDVIYVAPGDTIDFSLGPHHDALEVSKEIWDANDTVSNGGFRFPLGGGELVLDELGIYYYVCTPHAYLGMKGIIYVEEPSSADALSQEDKIQMKIFPNPASKNLNLSFVIEDSKKVKIDLMDITGKTVRTLANGDYQPGIYAESFDLVNLPPGRYFVHFQTNRESKVESLFLID